MCVRVYECVYSRECMHTRKHIWRVYGCVCHWRCVEVGGQLCRVGFLLPLCEYPGLNSGHQDCSASTFNLWSISWPFHVSSVPWIHSQLGCSSKAVVLHLPPDLVVRSSLMLPVFLVQSHPFAGVMAVLHEDIVVSVWVICGSNKRYHWAGKWPSGESACWGPSSDL